MTSVVRLPRGVKHGTSSAYRTYGCRCVKCRGWRAVKERRHRARVKGTLPPYTPPGRTHGLVSTYNAGCTAGPSGGPCEPCRVAARDAKRRQRLRLRRKHACESCSATFRRAADLAQHHTKQHREDHR